MAAARDGLDLVGVRNVLVQRLRVHSGGDDALALKSDYSLGRVLPVTNVTVLDSELSSDGCNALNFGSETVGDFTHIRWENIVVKSAGKAGIGIVTMDGAVIRDVVYRNITMTGVTTPIHLYVGGRQRAPVARVGAIRDVLLEDVTAAHCKDAGGSGHTDGSWALTLDGQPADAVWTPAHQWHVPCGPQRYAQAGGPQRLLHRRAHSDGRGARAAAPRHPIPAALSGRAAGVRVLRAAGVWRRAAERVAGLVPGLGR